MELPRVSVVIPTYGRDQVLVETIRALLALQPGPAEILVIDQAPAHEPWTADQLGELDRYGGIRWIRVTQPSIPQAMNLGLLLARESIVLFVDDDIVPHRDLVVAHQRAHAAGDARIVAGQVLQPGEEPLVEELSGLPFRFSSTRRQEVGEVMAGNVSMSRDLALAIGGFDENFVEVAYCFEADFSRRVRALGEPILFEPSASIRHLKASRGGTRAYGNHLTTMRPGHAVGAYYYLLRSKGLRFRGFRILSRLFRAVRTRHHLRRPWWIIPTLVAELLGFAWAVGLYARGPRLIDSARLEAPR